MSLKICSLSSSSSGNCVFIASEKTKILIDIGISLNRVGKSLRVLSQTCDNLSVLVTHTHSDHVSGISQACSKYNAQLHTHYLSADLCYKQEYAGVSFTEFGDGEFAVGDISVTPFRVSHDVPTVGFLLSHGGSKIGFATDLGCVAAPIADTLSSADLVFIEANHDEDLVSNNPRYPIFLKRRIMSQKGHLSNAASADLIIQLAKRGVKNFILGHLSKENNYPELAFNTVSQSLAAHNIKEGRDVKIEVAPADKMSSLFEVC